MLDDPFTGRGQCAPERSRMLVATEDGVFLWPGTALVYRCGNGFFAADPRAVTSALSCFVGPAAVELPLQTILERACDALRNGDVAIVQRMIDRLPPPAISPNGAHLIRAIAERQGLSIPDVPVASRQDGTVWNAKDIELFARLHDGIAPQAYRLEKVFNSGSAWDPAKHPRRPAGESDGGEFAPGGTGDGPIIPVSGPAPPWHNNPPERIGDPPEIPKTEPPTAADKFLAIRSVLYWLGNAAKLGSKFIPVINDVIAAAQAAAWLRPYVSAYLQAPKTLDELQADAQSPSTGYDIHHIVEQSAADDGIPSSLIDSPRNLVRIPTVKHWELNAWFSRPNRDYGGQTPRQYLKDKPWLERRWVGLDGLREVGVLK